LQSSVALNEQNGQLLGMLVKKLTTTDGVWSSYQGEDVQPEAEHRQERVMRVMARTASPR